MADHRRSAPSSGSNGGSIRVLVDNEEESSGSSSRPGTTVLEQPEKKLVKFAMVLVILQRMSTGIGALGFFWATTVILGNLADKSYTTDFYFITIILITEWARNFTLGRDVEWSLQSPWTISDALKGLATSFTKKIKKGLATSTSSNQKDHPPSDADDLTVLSRNLRKVLYCLQLLSALSCMTLSVARVIQLILGARISSNDDTNLRATVYVFYVMAIAQASLSLAEKAYWEWKITKLLDEVNRECHELGKNHITSFFYHAYSECVNGKVIDGLSLDLFSFASKLLNSHSRHEQLLIGVQVLHKYSTNPQYSEDTLRNIGTSMPVMEKLLYMLSWKKSHDAEIRRTAAEIVIKLAGRSWKSFQVSGFPGALEYISALLDPSSDVSPKKKDPSSHDDKIAKEQKSLAELGIKILAKLSNDHDNCEEIAQTRRLLSKLLDGLEKRVLRNHSAKILDNLCKKVGKDFLEKLNGVVAVASKVLTELTRSEEDEQPERTLALTRKLFSFMTFEDAKLVFEQHNGLTIDDVTTKLVDILNKNKVLPEPPNGMSPEELDKVGRTSTKESDEVRRKFEKNLEKVRRTTCNAINLATDTMVNIKEAASSFKIYGMDEALLQIHEATRSDSRYCKCIHQDVKTALDWLAKG